MSSRRRIGLAAAVAVLLVYSLAPFAWLVITSVKPPGEVFRTPPTYLPEEVTAENYRGLFAERPFERYIANSLVVGLGATLLAVAAGAPAAYALARLRLRHGGAILHLFLVGAIFPHIVYLIPLYELVRSLHLLNHPLALVVPYASLNLPFVIWVLHAFFTGIPRDLEDAARVDGFGSLGVLVRVIAPISAPAIATTGILVFIFAWNEFLFALSFMTRDSARTVPVGIAMLRGATVYEVPWSQISAAIVLTTLPVVALVFALQRRIVQGLTAGAVKG